MFSKKESYMNNEIYIVGGGASGLIAALAAAERGARVVILEKMDRAGRKLSITGNGRCNLTTVDDIEASVAAFGRNGRFLRSAFARFYSGDLIELMMTLGVPVIKQEGRGYFPESGHAADVTYAFMNRLKELGVEMRNSCAVERIVADGDSLLGLNAGGEFITTRLVLLATGGASYPGTGSSGDGYKLAALAGHKIVPPLPAVVPLTLEGNLHRDLAPLAFDNVRATLKKNDKVIAESEGDILFTPWGATGPAALALSKTTAANAGKGRMELIVNFALGATAVDVDFKLMRKFKSDGRRFVVTALSELLPRRAAVAITKYAGLPDDRRCAHVTAEERALLVELLAECRFRVTGTRPIAEAMVTAGGVALSEVDPKTMESKKVKGLYISGELLDLDAGTGGYNLQSAFSTGYVAGCSMAEMLKK
jgi:predicted Rossmann fold flavoprotein